MNQIEKEKNKLRKELISMANKSMKKRTYTFKYIDKSNSEYFSDVFDVVINEINERVNDNGFTLNYDKDEKRSSTTRFHLNTVYTVSVLIASSTDKLLAKTTKAKARDGDEISW